MSYIALYRKWRPLVFEDVVEQEHVVKTLKNCVKTGHIGHAYLFCGTRGTGKTTMAHILSRAINCISPRDGNPCNECEICRGILSGSLLDVIEIDAASNNSVDNIRDIRDEVVYAPSQARYKVYIIDEVHMLSTGAFNALLKTLEEPPSHVVFILATTEPYKLPATILSRCQRFDFRRITSESIALRLEKISRSTGIKVEKDALKLIARLSEGALRDAISLLDQCISSGSNPVRYEDVLSIVGIVNETFISDTVDAVKHKDPGKLLDLVENLVMDGKDISKFLSDLILHYRDLLVCKMSGNPAEVLDVTPELLETIRQQSAYFEKDEIISTIRYLSGLGPDIKWSVHPRVLLEVALIRLCEGIADPDKAEICERLSAIERRLDSGAIVSPSKQPCPIRPEASAEPGHAGHSDVPPVSTAKQKPGKTTAKGKDFEKWPDILNEIKSFGRMALYTYLLDGRAIELDSKRIGIVFQERSGLCKMMVSKAENLELLEKAALKVLGKEVAFRCMDEDEIGACNAKEPSDPVAGEADRAKEMANKLGVPYTETDD